MQEGNSGTVGAVVGWNKGTIREVSGYALTVQGRDLCYIAGGICGWSNGSSSIESCSSYGSVTTSRQGEQICGGICGVIGGSTDIINSLSMCTVSKTTLWGCCLGGIVGRANGINCRLKYCVYDGDPLTASAVQSYWRIYGVQSTWCGSYK